LAGTWIFIHHDFQRRHQRLDFVRAAVEGVPEDEADRGRDDQQHEGAHLPRLRARLVIEVHHRGDEAEQHEHFVQVGHRDVADVGPIR
jgi:hypothetical protein